MKTKKLEKQIMAMELAGYMYHEGRSYNQAWQEKMPSTRWIHQKIYWAIKKLSLKKMTKKYMTEIVIMKLF